MKKLLLISLIALSLGAWGQCSNNIASIYDIHKDTIVAGDTTYFGVSWVLNDTAGYCKFNPVLVDTVTANMFSLMSIPFDSLPFIAQYYFPGAPAEGYYDKTGKWVVTHDTLAKVQFVVPKWKAGWYKYEGLNVFRKVYIQSTVGINEITDNLHKTIKEVRYYTLVGQLYGSFKQPQTDLPSIPLLEEVIYNDNTIGSRSIIRLK